VSTLQDLPLADTAATEQLLTVRDLKVDVPSGGGHWLTAVEDVSFSVGRGETVGLVGESGSGKTLVSMAVMGLAEAVGARIGGGSIDFAGQELTTVGDRAWRELRGRELGMIFQQPIRSLNPAYTVGEQIAESARKHLGLSRRDARRRAVTMLDRVQIPNPAQRVDQYPHEFSGGMCQRVMIAMAMVASPRLLIADEPTTALDVTVQAKILELIRELQAETGVSVLFISHDLGVIAEVCRRTVVMYAGEVVEEGSVEDVFLRPQHPYTSALLGSASRTGTATRLRTIPGSIPRVGTAPQGCRFQPRCEFARAEPCSRAEPMPLLISGGHAVRCVRHDQITLEGVLDR
jgi:peptide/nickel transport system ATP-binding protein